MTSFWTQASTEDRLKQIDGGIECGMTSKQIAMCLGAPIYDDGRDNAVQRFASSHGRHFAKQSGTALSRANRIGGKVSGILTLRSKRLPETFNKDAFSIFDTPSEENPFASLSFEEMDT